MLLHLPPEILTQVVLLLPLKSIVVCKQVNHYIRSLILDSVEIRYLVQLLLLELVENPHCSLSIHERLSILEKRNRSKGIDARLRKRIRIPFQKSGIYDLTGGIYLLGDATRTSLHYMHLPDKVDLSNDEEIEWRGKEVRMEHTIIDMGLNVYEHDLLAVITMCAQTALQRNLFDIRLHLYKVSTALPHPEAQRPVISVTQVEWDRPALGIEIVGNNLVLILAYSDNNHKPDDRMFIYDWKSGVLKMSFRAPYQTYSGLIFVTQDVFMTPNSNNATFEYWRVPKEQSDAPTRPFFILALPELCPEDNVGIDTIECRAEPNPTSSFRHSPKPFHPDPYHAIAIFNISIRSREFRIIHNIPHPIQLARQFFLFVHRSSLAECLDRFDNYISYHDDPSPVPYDDWGQDICRWIPADGYSSQWITKTSGQKCVLFPEMGHFGLNASSESITMLDFNQTEVARVLADWVDESDEKIIINEGQKLDDYGQCFLNDVYGQLRFKKCETAPSFIYSGVMMDEQRVIGTQVGDRVHCFYVKADSYTEFRVVGVKLFTMRDKLHWQTEAYPMFGRAMLETKSTPEDGKINIVVEVPKPRIIALSKTYSRVHKHTGKDDSPGMLVAVPRPTWKPTRT
ncbi:hypothetical protein AGABI1DRAFT_77888 [Agaricus bisporus var. burnettii JB137-S8]|uniref:F-box domain-containing protein n=1 Tax=Agaricus bisporus var. burnettii (strain JB137-S8 / ATCC MYA-4627 / FGSC 10392) TaxID=597362 RepID=K5VRP1_AGABU|nr:uncharacterized protein AGABI1DRAFT_77888 [Agaricus bisporus var. burnettii JB137-S8]EKM77109.1 hypothetical protein AGABI1DRAFT_77888 [Agaricus bisporus var. burnettii JB137-S8]